MRLLISLPRYFLHEGHLQLRALKPINAAMSTICAAKIVSFENSPIRSGCLWSKTRNKRRTSVAAIARSWRLLRNPKSRAIHLLSLSCIIAILLLSENNNIYSNIILLRAAVFFEVPFSVLLSHVMKWAHLVHGFIITVTY